MCYRPLIILVGSGPEETTASSATCSFIYTALRCAQAQNQLNKASPAVTALFSNSPTGQSSKSLMLLKQERCCTSALQSGNVPNVPTSQFIKEEFQNSEVWHSFTSFSFWFLRVGFLFVCFVLFCIMHFAKHQLHL